MQGNICETCANLGYDEEDEETYCAVDMDEDEAVRFYTSPGNECPFYRNNDEYAVVRRQM